MRLKRHTSSHFGLAVVSVAALLLASACENMPDEIRQSFVNPKSAELAVAAYYGDVSAIDRLVGDGVSVDAFDDRGWNILDWALNGNSKEAYAHLLAIGADPNARADDQSTSLHFAALNSDPSWMKMLLDAGGDPNLQNVRHESALHKALDPRRISVVQLLLDSGADINQLDGWKQTPVMSATINFGNYPVIMLLLKRGACTTHRNPYGQDLLELIRKNVPAHPPFQVERLKVLKYLESTSSVPCKD